MTNIAINHNILTLDWLINTIIECGDKEEVLVELACDLLSDNSTITESAIKQHAEDFVNSHYDEAMKIVSEHAQNNTELYREKQEAMRGDY